MKSRNIFFDTTNWQQPQGGLAAFKLRPLDIAKAFERKSIEDFRDSQSCDAAVTDDLFSSLLGHLAVVFEFLGESPEPHLLAARLWVVLYCVRPDLIEYESRDSAALRFGIDEAYLRHLQRVFLEAVPRFRPSKRPQDYGKKAKIKRGQKLHRLRGMRAKLHASPEEHAREFAAANVLAS